MLLKSQQFIEQTTDTMANMKQETGKGREILVSDEAKEDVSK